MKSRGALTRLIMSAVLWGGGVLMAFSQEAAQQAEAVGESAMTFRQAWEYGGWIMWVLAAISVFALSMVFYFLWALRTGAVAPHDLLSDVLAKIRSGDLNEARRLSDKRPSPLSAIILTALDTVRNVPDCDSNLLRSVVEAEGVRQGDAIQGQTEFLLDIATIAPLLGLLGTVLGMLTAFGSVASDIASAKPVVLASGVSKAIVTTIFGLVVAIPCMAFYAWFRRRASRQISNLEAAASEVLTALISSGINGSKRL